MPLPDIYRLAIPVLASQVSIDIQLSLLTAFLLIPAVLIVTAASVAPIISVIPKRLSPDRPEVLIQAYLAEKTAWLAQYPTVQPTEYHKARKWKTL
jgi:hypothetical protein